MLNLNVFNLVILSVLMSEVRFLDAQCSQDPKGVFRFGTSCNYMCHCLNASEQCDFSTGECSSGCDWNWGGPGCQYRNIGVGQFNQHLDNDPGVEKWSSFADDQDLTTCSETATSRLESYGSPWWRLWFPQNETFRELSIVTRPDKLGEFRSFQVKIEYVPASEKDNRYYYPQNTLCYTHPNITPTSTKITVICDRPLVGNQVRIQLSSIDAHLVLCEVKVFAGRNIAFRRPVTTSSTVSQSSEQLAVDGSVGYYGWDHCTVTKWESQPWLQINLGYVANVRWIHFVKLNDDRLKNYQMQASNATGNGYQIVHDDNTDPPTVDIRQRVTAEYFRLQKVLSDRLALCELEIYGDCLDNVCGLDCSQVCHCANPVMEDKMSGTCSSGCTGRWTGLGGKCNKECASDEWGENCQNTCGNCYVSEPCAVNAGSCPSGCIPGYQPPKCIDVCADGRYGRNCTFNCSDNCHADDVCGKTDGRCPNGCKTGYMGNTCFDKCPSGWFGDGCKEQCSANCIYESQICHHVTGQCSNGCNDGWKGVYCDQECDVGTWGSNCSKMCGNCVEGQICRNINGFCENGCAAGFEKTDVCKTECLDGRFGIECARNCSNNCKDVCNKVDGTCSVCRSGWKGSNCTTECEYGEWGQGCNQTCGMCASGVSCDRISGTCSGGCMPGYQNTPLCDKNCIQGTYGRNCEVNCSDNCYPPGICNTVDGFCDRCLSGWKGSTCEEECDDGLYGANCNASCGGCANNTCDKVTGFCKNGCKPGYIVSDLCNKECEGKTYGNNCSLTCGNCKGGTPCDTQTGDCPNECDYGFTGETCAERIEMPPGSSPDFPVPTVVGVVAGCFVIVAVVFVVLFVRRRRLTRKDTESQNYFDNITNEDGETSGKEFDNKTYVDTSNMYVNASEVTAAVPTNRDKFLEERGSSAGRASSLSQSKHQEPLEDTGDLYYNAGPVTKQTSDTAISVANFEEYVKGGTKNQEFFEKEFQKIPYGLVHPTKMARKTGNAGKNRYKEMYAYDHSRVVLQTLPDDPDSDYINASYIRGHCKYKAYIAAQGPMPANVVEFWRMIWENDVRIVAMVTNMVEETKTKCIKYWEAVESTAEYGSVQIFTEKEDVYAEYTIRHFKVFHKDKPGKVQKVQHFQYTAWPDKGIPSSTSSLLHFWRKVRKADKEKSHPWLVHCSAGVGRTGTFIALDILYDQGKELGYLDVFQCVKDLRDQRVNMVQTKEQYKYLHKILVEMFLLPSEPVGVEEFSAVYQNLQELDQNKKKPKLLLAYESLHDETSDVTLSNPGDNIYSCAKQADNKDKNRYDNILASNEYRPILSTYVDGCTNYINAVFVPSYCDANGYILTQTPLPHTAVDLCRLIHEQEVEVIVSFDDHTNEEVGVVFPDEGSVSVGPFVIGHITTERQAVYTQKAFSLSYQNKKRTVFQLVFNHWPKELVVPEDPYKMLSFLQDLDKLQRQHDKKPIIIQCLNGAERSGLVVILRNILERAMFDEEISIPQVIRQMRLRRQQIIPNFEQFRLCYEVFLCYSESSATYANM